MLPRYGTHYQYNSWSEAEEGRVLLDAKNQLVLRDIGNSFAAPIEDKPQDNQIIRLMSQGFHHL